MEQDYWNLKMSCAVELKSIWALNETMGFKMEED